MPSTFPHTCTQNITPHRTPHLGPLCDAGGLLQSFSPLLQPSISSRYCSFSEFWPLNAVSSLSRVLCGTLRASLGRENKRPHTLRKIRTASSPPSSLPLLPFGPPLFAPRAPPSSMLSSSTRHLLRPAAHLGLPTPLSSGGERTGFAFVLAGMFGAGVNK